MDLPSGSMIIAEVPVPPAVYRQLRSQAEAAGQTPSQLMASIDIIGPVAHVALSGKL